MKKKTIGIIGGMGPLATCDLMEKIIRNTRAATDQEHIHIITDCNTCIPDRTKAILEGGTDPVPEMVKSIKRLQEGGADLLIMPCNTAHYFYDRLQAAADIPILHMLRETAKTLHRKQTACAAVFATDGTVRTGIYDRVLKEQGIRAVYPTPDQQKLLMCLIYDYVKSGKPGIRMQKPYVRELLETMYSLGAQKMILGCTELPIAFDLLGMKQDTVDPTLVLARAAVTAAGYETVSL